MIATMAFMYLPEEVGPLLPGNAAKEGSAYTYLVKSAIYETVSPSTMLNATEHNRVF